MKETIVLARAIGTEYLRRVLKPIAIIVATILVALLLFGGWLTTMSAWWWLLQSVFIIATIGFVVGAIILTIVIRLLDTAQIEPQKQAVRTYVDKLERVAENLQTPQPIIIFKVIRDTVRPRPDGFIQTISKDSKSLVPDYKTLRQDF